MKTFSKAYSRALLGTFFAVLSPSIAVCAQFTTLHSFTGGAGGDYPLAGLIQGSDGRLYGTVEAGGANNAGTVFAIKTDGTGFTTLHSFTGGADGGYPSAGLIQGSDGRLYGTALGGGTNNAGTVFAIKTDGTGFTTLYSFTNGADGGYSQAGLIQGSDGRLYGTANGGGTGPNYAGTIFAVKTDGTGFTTLYSFTGGADGGYPVAGLIQGSDGRLYSTEPNGGPDYVGTVFAIKTDGTGFTTLYTFTNGADGGYPQAGLIQGSDGRLYGTAANGGVITEGSVFAIKTDGTGFTTLYSFTGGADSGYPVAGLIQGSDGRLYGTTESGGGGNDYGSVFALNTDGTGFTTLYSFTNGADGSYPVAGLIQGSDGRFYSTALEGGTNNKGTVFALLIPLTIAGAPNAAASGVVTGSFFYEVQAIGGVGSYNYAVTGGSLPPGLTLNPAGGGIGGSPTAPGTFPVTITVTDSATPTHNTATLNLTITIAQGTQATPVVTWGAPPSITYGTALDGTQLNATANVPGTFAYTPAAGTVLGIGANQTLSVTFTPLDSTDYATVIASTTISVGQAPASVALSNTSQTYSGSPEPVSVTTSPANLSTAVTYNGSATAPTAAGTYAVVATVTDPNYTGSATGTLVIGQATPALTWNAPAAITYGTALGASQLNATSNVSGSFAYSPASGTILPVGSNQALSATFTPADAVDYTSGGPVGTAINVNPAPVAVSLSGVNQTYNGLAEPVSISTTPSGLSTTVTYNGSSSPPVAAGSYAVVVTVTNPDYTGSASGTLIISKATASLTLGALSQTYGGGIEDANAATSPAGLTVLWSYNGQPLAFTPSGDTLAAYAPAVGQTLYVNATGATGGAVAGSNPSFGINSDLGTAAVQAGILTVGQSAVLQVTISADGSTFAIVQIATSGFTAGPIDVGTYAVTGTVVDFNYSGAVTGTLVISQATPIVTWGAPPSITYGTALDGTQLNATANVPGTFAYTPAAGTVLGIGANQTLSVTFTPLDSTDYATVIASTTISVGQAPASVALSNTSQTYSGSPEPVSVTTSPANLSTAVTYNGSAIAPTAAGTYSVVATVTDPNYTGSATGTLVIGQATPALTWNAPAAIAYGTALGAAQLNAASSVPGSFAYSPASGTILPVGSNQALSAIFTPVDAADYTSGGTVGTAITVNPAPATIALGGLNKTYSGSTNAASVTTAPANLSTIVTYNGNATAPTAAGSYAVVATVTNPDYTGSASGTLVIAKATPALVWNSPAAITYGIGLGAAQLDATSSVPGAFAYSPASGTVLPVGSNQALSATFTPTDSVDYKGTSVSTTITVKQASAAIALSGLNQTYTGEPLTVTATTNPANLSVSITYNGGATAPTYPGTYAVVATITDSNHAGTISASLIVGTTGLVNQAPVLNGNAAFEGSIQMLSAESVNMSANSYISGDLLVPGTPTLQVSGNARVAGTINAGGAAAPTNYDVTLSGDALLRYLVRQINPLPMPSVAAPPSSRRNVTLNSNAPPTALAAGNYGSVIVNSSTTLIVGVADATNPSVYNIQNLIINGNGTLEVVGPVAITAGGSMALNGNCGAKTHPEWLALAVANGGVTLNSGVTFDGSIIAPAGQVIVDSNSTLNGTVTCDRLLLNGGAVVDPNNP